MTRNIGAVLAAAFLLPVASFAADAPVGASAAAPAHPARKAKVESPDDMVCKTVRDSGSRISTGRACMTRGEWAQQGATARDALMGSHPGTGMPK